MEASLQNYSKSQRPKLPAQVRFINIVKGMDFDQTNKVLSDMYKNPNPYCDSGLFECIF